MKRYWSSVLLVLLTLSGLSGIALACGVKFMVPSVGSRSQRPREASAILIYDSGEELRHGLAGNPEDTFREAGFRPTVVGTAGELEQKVNASRWDAVLVGGSEARSVSERIGSGPAPALVVPVMLNATDAQVKNLRDAFPVVLRLPAKTAAFMSAVDKALEFKTKKTSKVQ